MDNRDTGLLLDEQNLKLQRFYFEELVRLKGIQVIYRAPRENKHYNGYGELDTFFYEPKVVGCIFDEHPNQWTMKKLGWSAELQEEVSVIHVPYNLFRLQAGSMFIIPSALDNSQGRMFRVIKMSTISIYPASVACQIAPEWENKFEKSQLDFDLNNTENFTLLKEEED